MIRSKSRSLSPEVGVNIHHTAVYGLPKVRFDSLNNLRKRSDLMQQPKESLESSTTSTNNTLSQDASGGPSHSNTTSTFSHSAQESARTITVAPYDAPATRPKLHAKNAIHGTVDKIVYESARFLTAAHPDEDFTIFGDVPRTTIVVKWMRYYNYYPNTDKAIDKLRRDELKNKLNIPPGSGQRLGSFIINKFNSFRKWGYVYWDGKHLVEYDSATDAWLSPTWDGVIERPQSSLQRVNRSPSAKKVGVKRPNSERLQQREKRQKSNQEKITISLLESPTTPPNESVHTATTPDPHPIQPKAIPDGRPTSIPQKESDSSFHNNQTKLALRNDTNTARSQREKEHSEEGSNSLNCAANRVNETLSTTTLTSKPTSKTANLTQPTVLSDASDRDTDELANNDDCGRYQAPNHRELSARLEAVKAQSESGNTHGSQTFQHHPSPTKHTGTLGILREKEKVCMQALRESMEELESARALHKGVCQQYETLKAEVKVTAQVLEQASRREKAAVPPTPNGMVEPDFADSFENVLQNRRNIHFFRAKQEEKLALENQIAEAVEAKANLKMCIAAKKVELKQLQGDIKERRKDNSRSVRFKEKYDALLHDFKEVQSHSSSGTTSPVGSAPGSLSSELSELDDEKMEGGADLMY
jgi:hypothetical protein